MYFFSLFLSSTGQWRRRCIRFKTKRKYLTRITARATSLYKLHDDLQRQIGFLFEDIRCALHLSGGDVSDDKLKAPAALPSSSCPRGFVNDNFPPFLCICMFLGDHTALRRLMSQSLFFSFFFATGHDGRFAPCLVSAWREGNTEEGADLHWSQKQAVEDFFALSCLPHKVHRPSGSNFISLKVLYVRILV